MRKRTVLEALVLTAAVASSGCATTAAIDDAETAKTNTQTVLAFEETVFNKHQVKEGFDHYVGATYKQHNPLVPDGKDGAVKALSFVLANVFPNSRVVVKKTVAQGDLVAAHVFWDQKPGQTRGVAIVDLYRLEAGKIVEHWDVVQEIPEKAANDNTMF